MEIPKKTVKRNTILNAFRMLLTVLVPLATIPYTSRIFQAEGIGQLNFASSAVEIFAMVSTLGISTYGVREGAKVREDREVFSEFVREMLWINIRSVIVAYLLFFFAMQLVPAFQSGRMLLLLYSLLIGSAALSMEWVCGVYEEYGFLTIRQAAVQLSALALLFTFVRGPGDVGLWAAVTVSTTFLSHIVTAFHVRKYVDFMPGGRQRVSSGRHKAGPKRYKAGPKGYKDSLKRRRASLKRHWRPVLILFATALAGKVYSDVNTVLLGVMASDYHTGMYSAAVKVNTILIACFTAMAPVFLPRIVALLGSGQDDAYIVFFGKILGLVFAAGIPVVAGIWMLGRQIITLLAGTGFQEAAVTMRILAPVILANACANILYYNFLVPYKKENTVLFCISITALLNIGLSVVLIPSFAHNGAAAASLAAELSGLMLAVFFCCREDRRIVQCVPVPSVMHYVFGAFLIVLWCSLCGRVFSGLCVEIAAAVAGSIAIYALALVFLHDPIAEEGTQMIRSGWRKLMRRNSPDSFRP